MCIEKNIIRYVVMVVRERGSGCKLGTEPYQNGSAPGPTDCLTNIYIYIYTYVYR